MPKTNYVPTEAEQNLMADIQARIAAKVRADSQHLAQLTSAAALIALVADLVKTDTVEIDLTEMLAASAYHDLKLVTTSTEAIYLYSETYIAKNTAETLIRLEEMHTRIATKVRTDSQQLAKLTRADACAALAADLETDAVQFNLAEMLKDERFQDMQSITVATGVDFLFSETYITKNYAAILARAEANDPGVTIAETVREESRLYPRPTNVVLFEEQVFNITPEQLETFLAHSLGRQEFQDIRLIQASTGARYLYSNLHLSADYAQSLVEWEEVGRDQNP